MIPDVFAAGDSPTIALLLALFPASEVLRRLVLRVVGGAADALCAGVARVLPGLLPIELEEPSRISRVGKLLADILVPRQRLHEAEKRNTDSMGC